MTFQHDCFFNQLKILMMTEMFWCNNVVMCICILAFVASYIFSIFFLRDPELISFLVETVNVTTYFQILAKFPFRPMDE